MPADAPATWILHDGHAGNRRQAVALADALGLSWQERVLQSRLLARWLAPRRLAGAAASFGEDFAAALRDQPPSLAIGCGRQAALATRFAHAAGARTVQILDPRIDPRHWDLVVAPEHDGLVGINVITLAGSLHPVDAAWLQRARDRFPGMGLLPGPRTAVLLGGPTRAVRFDRSAFEVMMTKLEYWLARGGGSLLLCGSRRTPQEVRALARERYGADPGVVWMDEADGENPYAGVLGWAQRIVVSPDSVNMVSEACATAAPVYVAEPGRATGRVRRYLDDLLRRGRIRAQAREPEDVAVEPLFETARIAAIVRERLSPR
jgi:mitochondrial fission protein ELM1